MRRLATALAALLLAVGLAPGQPAAASSPDPWPSPLGANNWLCRPSKAHPNPVILLHGYTANRFLNWNYHSPRLAARGYCVFAITYGRRTDLPFPANAIGGAVPMEQSAEELSAFVDKVLRRTGARKVDIVGHSEGSLMPNYYVKFLGGAAKVDKYVGLTPLWDGTTVLGLDELNEFGKKLGLDPTVGKFVDDLCGPCRSFLKGSEFLEKMSSGGGPRVPGVDYTMIMTRYDEVVLPYTSGFMEGAENIVLQDVCADDLSEHVLVAIDPNVNRLILNALDPANTRRPNCTPPDPEDLEQLRATPAAG